MSRPTLPSRGLRNLGLGALLSASALLACANKTPSGPPPPSAPSQLQEKPVPAFSRKSLTGATVDTEALLGKVVVVKFFAEYCEPCKRTLPAAQALHAKYEDVAFIGISEDEGETAANRVVQTYGLTFDVVLDRANVLAGRFRVSEIPVTFVVDPQGKVAWVGGPGVGEDDLEAAVRMVAGL